MKACCLWSKVQAGAGWDVRSPIEHLCDVMRQKILLQDVQMMTATFLKNFYFLYHLVPPAFLKLKFWLSSIMFNSSLVNSFKSNLCYLKKKSQSKYLLSIKDIYNGSVCQRLVAWLTVDPWHGVNIPVQQRGTSPKQAFVVSFQFKHLRPV